MKNIPVRIKVFCVTRENFGRKLMSHQDILCQRHFWTMKKIPLTGKEFLSQEDICGHSKKTLFTGRNFLSQGKKNMYQEESSCQSNFLRREET